MNITMTGIDSVVDLQDQPILEESRDSSIETPLVDEVSELECLVADICRDANHDSMRFVLRNNVGIDGE